MHNISQPCADKQVHVFSTIILFDAEALISEGTLAHNCKHVM